MKKKSFGDFAGQRSVWWDILKLLWFRDAKHRYVFLLTFGSRGSPLGSDVGYLGSDVSALLARQNDPCWLEQIVVPECRQDLPYYQERFLSVAEVLFNEFDTALADQLEGGRVRVSLIEVKCKN